MESDTVDHQATIDWLQQIIELPVMDNVELPPMEIIDFHLMDIIDNIPQGITDVSMMEIIGDVLEIGLSTDVSMMEIEDDLSEIEISNHLVPSASGISLENGQLLPLVRYNKAGAHLASNVTRDHMTECAICLNEYNEDEDVRLLPKCDHIFHPICIDTWFASHTTCPLCRTDAPTEMSGQSHRRLVHS